MMGENLDKSAGYGPNVHGANTQAKKPSLWSRIIKRKNAAKPKTISLSTPPLSSRYMPDLLNLRSLSVSDVLVPKADIIAIPVSTDQDELIQLFRESGMTRIPVYNGTLDTPLGFVHLKDFVLGHSFANQRHDFDLSALLRPLLFVPASMPLAILLQKMQAERVHMALVIDEYGGTDGLITIEDLLEQVVGAIEDEHDIEEEKSWVLEKAGSYQALAKTPLADFETEIGLSLTDVGDVAEEDIDTLGGLVTVLSGSVPVRGELIRHPKGIEFEVIDADPRRIKRLRIRLPSK